MKGKLLDDSAELSHIAGPGVSAEFFDRIGLQSFVATRALAFEKVIRKSAKIGCAIAKRWQHQFFYRSNATADLRGSCLL